MNRLALPSFTCTLFNLFILFFLLLRFLNLDCDGQPIDLSIMHASNGSVSIFFGIIVDNGIIFESPESARVNMSEMRKYFTDMILRHIRAQVLDDNRNKLDTVL